MITNHYKNIWFSVVILVIVSLIALLVSRQTYKQYSLRYMIAVANFMSVSSYGQAQDGTLVTGPGLVVLNEHKHPEILSLIKSSTGFHSIPTSPTIDYIVDLQSYSDKGHTESYGYSIITGELGRDHDWCYVPKAFRMYIKTLPKPDHPKYKIIRTPYYEAIQQVK